MTDFVTVILDTNLPTFMTIQAWLYMNILCRVHGSAAMVSIAIHKWPPLGRNLGTSYLV
eukprot:COSAG05_NODE_1049_length_6033_cov_7.763566_4_plen_59_part_00